MSSPYAAPVPVARSPPNSPRSFRSGSSHQSGGSQARHHGRSGPGSSSISPVRERRLSWQTPREQRHQSGSSDSDLLPQLFHDDDDDRTSTFRPEHPDRTTSSEEMPPPTWTATTKYQRRRSLGVAASPYIHFPNEASIPERRTGRESSPSSSSDDHGRRSSSLSNSLSSASELQIRPRIVVSRQHTKSMHHAWKPTLEPTPPKSHLSRSHSSLSTRHIGPAATSTSSHMRRSESEGGQSESKILTRTYSEGWVSWVGRPESPAPSPRAESPAVGDDNSWLGWGRERLWSAGPASVPFTVASASDQLEEAIVRTRTRRHSASAADLLGLPRTLSLPVEPSTPGRLAALLATRSVARPRSIISVSSISSQDTEQSSPSTTRSLPTRRLTKSLMRRDLASSLVARPLTPKLDESLVVSFPTTTTDSLASPLSQLPTNPLLLKTLH